ncbi:undecaprenyl/decaprenyl-phosphate alpha-N-acetylglucosaminyl 1-phosphate transferase [Mesobacillus boroniphilus]|uniref:Undecaprenyl/decaprenyl-phosphate alpha-N-acetylglucosaminyl 1-phosphate transferase n=1 Tax=Mesobacillus boroniphilus TaxID=308892 RepID=A0A944GYG8_9BACI|nr:MraY family glycosyltransferase [Mesobacillus boroniphilus]MBS8265765.1 undecaprenyl/decaprenyl-phosphate alpha-N-acetylglucosaminyl 1-phosphate transferase [Mesobacillus boroniphilus]
MPYFILICCFLLSLLLTPIVKAIALKIGATDKPNHRKVHERIMPRLGGLAIFISFVAGVLLSDLSHSHVFYILLGSSIIVLTGIVDDLTELSAKIKLIGQLLAAAVIILGGGMQIDFVALPFGGEWDFTYLSVPVTFLWIIGVTNSINLIDGLDGLASGVSSIAIVAITSMAIIKGDFFVSVLGLILLMSTLGFLVHNFHPAKIFLGDTGSLFLGFIISVLSLLGFKNVTFISLIVPVIILGVPLSDTFFAIIRRISNNKPLTAPDKYHLHHCLLHVGLTHRQAVLSIYGMAAMFAAIGMILMISDIKGTYFHVIILLVIIELFAEKIGWVGKEFKPILSLLKFLNQPMAKK